MDLGGLIDDLIHRDEAERHLPPVDDRAEAGAGGADRHAGQRRFGNRGRPDPLVTELLEQWRQRIGGHVEDLGIAPHLLGDGLERGLAICELSHRLILESVLQWGRQAEKTSSVACSGKGNGLASAKAMAASRAPMMSSSMDRS